MSSLHYILDLDGTVYNGSKPIPQAACFIRYLQSQHRPFVFFTNSAEKPPEAILHKLLAQNIDVEVSQIVTSGCVAKFFLNHQASGKNKTYAIGSQAFKQSLHNSGVFLVEENAPMADYVLVSFDEHFCYKHLKQACFYLQNGATLLATNTDPTIPTAEGIVPHTGALVSAIETASGKTARIFGKPSKEAHALLRSKLGEGPIAIVGDRLDTDMAFGFNNGFSSFLTLTGITTPTIANSNTAQFTKCFAHLGELQEYDSQM